ncbi:MAG: molybdate ABC transporter substrate-binding protein [Armatimonadetes bacterium]|nr:molybdate ABC transporter substrate-binding protein [Armatimonadota bacterium]
MPATAPAAGGQIEVYVPCGLAGPYGDAAKAFLAAHPEYKLGRKLENELPLRNRIRDGATPDVFISLGELELQSLRAKHCLVEGADVRLATAPLALIAPPKNPLKLRTLTDFARPDVKYAALADADQVSAGAEGKQALEQAGLWPKVEKKVRFTPRAQDTLTFVAEGKVDVSIAYKSCLGEVHTPGDVPTETNVTYVCDVPGNLHHPVYVTAVQVAGGRNPAGAKAFLEFLATPEARQTFVKWRFDPLPAGP